MGSGFYGFSGGFMNRVKNTLLIISAAAFFSFFVSCGQEDSLGEEKIFSSVSGTVRLESKAIEGISVLLVKVKNTRDKIFLPDFSSSFPSISTDSGGSYKFTNVSPGFYQVFAFSSMEEGAFLKKDLLVREGEDSVLSDFIFYKRHPFSVQLSLLSPEPVDNSEENKIQEVLEKKYSGASLSGFILSVPQLMQVSVTNVEGKAFFDAADFFSPEQLSHLNNNDFFLLTLSKDNFYKEYELSYKSLLDSCLSEEQGQSDGSIVFVIEINEEEIFENKSEGADGGLFDGNGLTYGLDGRDGQDGKDGKDGLDGKNGRDGKDGIDGINGRDGLDGKDGLDGRDGKSIVWLGAFSGFDDEKLKNPEELSAFFNLSDGSSWIYTGGKWSLLAKAGDSAVSLFVDFKKSTGQRCSDSLVITAKIFHREEIKEVSWIRGEFYNEEAFFENPERTIIPFDQEESLSRFEVYENGIYTLGLMQIDGQKRVECISVTNIDREGPEPVRNFSLVYNSFQNEMLLSWNNPCDRDFTGLLLTGKRNGEIFLEEKISSSFEKSEEEYVISDIFLDEADYYFTLQAFDDFDNLSQTASLSYKNIYGFHKKEFLLSCKHFASREDSYTDVKVKFSGRKKISRFLEMEKPECFFCIFDGDKLIYQEKGYPELEGEVNLEGKTDSEGESFFLFYSANLKVPYLSKATSSGKKYSIRLSVNGQILEDLEENILVTADSEITDFYIEENNSYSIDDALSVRQAELFISGYNLDLMEKAFVLFDKKVYKIEGETFSSGWHSFSINLPLPEQEGSYEITLYSLNEDKIPLGLYDSLDSVSIEDLLNGQEEFFRKISSTSLLIYGSLSFSDFYIPPAGTSVSGKNLSARISGTNFNSPAFNKSLLSYSIVKENFEEPEEGQKEVLFESSSWSSEYCQEESFCSNVENLSDFEESPFRVIDFNSMEVLLPLPDFPGKYKVFLYYGQTPDFPLLEGEIVLKDYSSFIPGSVIYWTEGKILSKPGSELLPSEMDCAFAVCLGFSENGIPLGLGLHNSYENRKEGYLSWALKDTSASLVKFEKLICLPSSLSADSLSVTFSGNLSGKKSLSIIQDEIPFETSDLSLLKENLPAFYYCFSYGETFMLPDQVKEGWYLPSVYELYQIYSDFEKIQGTLNLFNSSLCENISGFYYSSSQDTSAAKVYKMNFSSGKFSAGLKTTSNNSYVLAVREFE